MNVLLEQIRLGLESNDSVAPVLAMAIEHNSSTSQPSQAFPRMSMRRSTSAASLARTVVQYRATPARPVLLSGSLAGSGGAILDGRRNGSDWRGLR